MTGSAIRVYADTSVFGGVFDEEFAGASKEFFEQVRQGRYGLVVSRMIFDELEDAPGHVKDFFSVFTRRRRSLSMRTRTKRFDCVEMKRRGARKIYERTKGMSVEEETAYWRKRSEEFRREQEVITRLAAPRK